MRRCTPALLLSLLAATLAGCESETEPLNVAGMATVGASKIFDRAPADCSKLIPTPATFGDPSGLGLGWGARDAELAFVVDDSFVEFWGAEWPSVAQRIIADMDAFYTREIDLSIVPIQLAQLSGFDVREYPVPPDTTAALAQASLVMEDFIAAYQAQFGATPRDSVQLFVGADVAGQVAGMANCIGGAGFADVAFVWGEADNQEGTNFVGPLGFFEGLGSKVAIHEFGHMLGAHHHYTSCVEPLASFNPADALGVCGVMINDIGLSSFSMSSANRLATRSWADQVDL